MRDLIYERTYRVREPPDILEPHTPENLPDRKDIIENILRKKCIEQGEGRFLWFDNKAGLLSYIEVCGSPKHALTTGEYTITLHIQTMPSGQITPTKKLPRELSDLLKQKKFKLIRI